MSSHDELGFVKSMTENLTLRLWSFLDHSLTPIIVLSKDGIKGDLGERSQIKSQIFSQLPAIKVT